jgi:hypothetical protein
MYIDTDIDIDIVIVIEIIYTLIKISIHKCTSSK